MKGEVEMPTAKLFNQLALPPRETPLARMLSGKTSETTIHETGPQLHFFVRQTIYRIVLDVVLPECEESNKQPDKNDADPAGCEVRRPAILVRSDKTSNNEMTYSHADCTSQ